MIINLGAGGSGARLAESGVVAPRNNEGTGHGKVKNEDGARRHEETAGVTPSADAPPCSRTHMLSTEAETQPVCHGNERMPTVHSATS